jgi:GTP-dependent phosphoenolpyruvate carboxykinase
MKISPQVPVRRRRRQLSFQDWIEKMKRVQSAFVENDKRVPTAIMKEFEETQVRHSP